MDGGFTEFMACMSLENEAWGEIQILPLGNIPGPPQSSGEFFGLTVSQTVRISPDDSGGMALFCVKQAITRLNIAAGERLMPMADEGKVLEALMRLADSERHILYDGGRFFARIMLSSADMSQNPYPVKSARLVITLWHDREEISVRKLRVRTDVSSFADLVLRRELAVQTGFDGALMLDSVYKKYILGLAGSNVFFRTDSGVIAPFGECVFGGITRGCAIELMRSWEIEVSERRISVDELLSLYSDGRLYEAFATDTFNIVSAVIGIDGLDLPVELEKGKLSKKLFDAVRNIERGTYPAPHGWVQRI